MPFNLLVQETILDFEQCGLLEVFDCDLRILPVQKSGRNNLPQVIVGTRRCGKTYRLFQEMRDVARAGYDPEMMLYFNFEDERLKPYPASLLTDVLDTFFAMRPRAREEGFFLFFDEIQEVPDWSLFLRRMGDADLSSSKGFSSADAAVARDALSEYLLRGGYMAALDLPVSDGMMLMQEYAYRTVAMDVVERYNLRTPQIAMSFFN